MNVNLELLHTLYLVGTYKPDRPYLVSLLEEYEDTGLVEVESISYQEGKSYTLSTAGVQALKSNGYSLSRG